MGEFLDFVSNNYVWFVVGGIILLMALIGFIAEKTDFGKKPLKEKKVAKKESEEIKKTDEEVKPVLEPSLEASEGENLDTLDFDIKDDSEGTSETVAKEDTVEDFLDTDVSEPVTANTNTEDLNAPFGDNEEKSVEEDKNEEMTSDEEVKPVLEPSLEKIDEEKLPLPEIDKIDDNDDEDDDVWKF